MRKIEEVLRLKWGHQLSNRQIANSCLISHTTVREYLDRARLPETSNFKHEGPRPVKITYMEHWQYDLDPFLEILPELHAAPKPSTNGQQGKSDYTKENITALRFILFRHYNSRPEEAGLKALRSQFGEEQTLLMAI